MQASVNPNFANKVTGSLPGFLSSHELFMVKLLVALLVRESNFV